MSPDPITIDLTKVHPSLVPLYVNSAIAQHIMGWQERDSSFEECQWEDPATGERHGAREWATSADAVLELLNCHQWRACSCGRTEADPAYPDAIVWVGEHEAFGPLFAFAACVALLRARGIEVLL